MEETLNESITEQTEVPSVEADNDNSGNPPTDGSNRIADGEAGVSGGDSGSPMESPFDPLLQFEEFDSLEDILGDVDPSDNPFAGGLAPSGDVVPSTNATATSESNGNNPLNADPNTEASLKPGSGEVADGTGDGVGGNPFAGGGSMMNADFSGSDTGVSNTDNGNGNNFVGDSEGESGSNNQADGNGNWFYGNDNQVNGNGNWNLSGEDSIPLDSISEGENNPLASDNPQGDGEEGGIPAEAFGGNNPVFAGGGTTPAGRGRR